MLNTDDKVRVLKKNQIWDRGRGQFTVKMKPSGGKRYRGLPVYEDAFGMKFVIEGSF